MFQANRERFVWNYVDGPARFWRCIRQFAIRPECEAGGEVEKLPQGLGVPSKSCLRGWGCRQKAAAELDR